MDIRPFIEGHLLAPLKQYNTTIQDTIIKLIAEKLQLLYDYTVYFPEILTPNQYRLDILKAIADQFAFTVRDEGDLQEQIDILSNIIYIYKKRGSIDTIENMWRYYGGDLPKDVQVVVPFSSVFRYSRSRLSSTHVFASGGASYIVVDPPVSTTIDPGAMMLDSRTNSQRVITGALGGSSKIYLTTVEGLNIFDKVSIEDSYEGIITDIYTPPMSNLARSGVYEVRLINNTYPIPDLKEFMLKELVAAGNYIYFTNAIHMNVLESEDSNYYKYIVHPEEHLLTDLNIQLEAPRSHSGLKWSDNPPPSGYEVRDSGIRRVPESYYSGKQEIFIEFTNMTDIGIDDKYNYHYDLVDAVLGILLSITDISGEIEETESDEGDGNKFKSNITLIRSREEEYCRRLLDIYISNHSSLSCTTADSSTYIASDLYENEQDYNNSKKVIFEYPGYFVLGSTRLRKEVI